MGKPTPKYLLVENHIKDAIANRSLTDRLPGERILAKQLGISYMTVRKAIDRLVEEGVLYRVPTKGTFVAVAGRRPRAETRTIGYFLDSGIESGISSPYYSMIFNAIEKVATRNGYAVLYFADQAPSNLASLLAKLDGVIATCLPRVEDIIHQIRREVPVVVIDNASADKTIPSVIIDNFNADLQTVNHVCGLGHRRIGFMTGLDDSDIGKNRFAGYRTGLSMNGLGYDERLVFRGNYSFESGIKGAEYFLGLKEAPTAIVCANDSMALGAMRRLHQADVRVPEDVSIVGFDDIEVASQIVPALTTNAAPVNEIAECAFDMLMRQIRHQPIEQSHVALPAKLVVRQTCAEHAMSTA